MRGFHCAHGKSHKAGGLCVNTGSTALLASKFRGMVSLHTLCNSSSKFLSVWENEHIIQMPPKLNAQHMSEGVTVTIPTYTGHSRHTKLTRNYFALGSYPSDNKTSGNLLVLGIVPDWGLVEFAVPVP